MGKFSVGSEYNYSNFISGENIKRIICKRSDKEILIESLFMGGSKDGFSIIERRDIEIDKNNNECVLLFKHEECEDWLIAEDDNLVEKIIYNKTA